MSYRTCHGCQIDKTSCGIRKKLRAAIKGHNVTSIKFRCADRVPAYIPGQRVIVTWQWADEESRYYGMSANPVSFKATVIDENPNGKFRIYVDSGPCIHYEDHELTAPDCLEGNGFAKVTVAKLEPLDEPARIICKHCDCVEGQLNHCWNDNESSYSKDCLKSMEPS